MTFIPVYHRNSRHIFSTSLLFAFGKFAVENTKYCTLKLNSLQFETIRNLFTHYDWDFDECIIGEKKSFESVQNNEQNVEVENRHQNIQGTGTMSNSPPRNTDRPDNTNDGNGDDGGNDGGDDGHEDSDSSDTETGCRFCFLSPCVITHRQLWLSDQTALRHARNSE